jgi:hypothetical protein
VDWHQCVEREREEAEPRGPDPASPLSRSHSGAPALGSCCGTILAESRRLTQRVLHPRARHLPIGVPDVSTGRDQA